MMPENFAFAKVKVVGGYPNKSNNPPIVKITRFRFFGVAGEIVLDIFLRFRYDSSVQV